MRPKKFRGAPPGAPSELVPRQADAHTYPESAPRLQHLARHLHRLGPRPLHELLIETFGPELRDFLRARLSASNAIAHEIYTVFGADRFPLPFGVLEGGVDGRVALEALRWAAGQLPSLDARRP